MTQNQKGLVIDQPFRELLAYLGGFSLALGILALALAFAR